MTRRLGIVVSLAALAVAIAVGTTPSDAGADATQAVGSSQYVVRADRRACPAPRCGGYFVALANRAVTPCGDGTQAANCYVARVVDRQGAAVPSIKDDSLARAAIEIRDLDGMRLGVLVAAEVRAPFGIGTKGSFFRVRDTGIVCVRAPCFSYRAWRLNGSASVRLSAVDLKGARPGAAALARARKALGSKVGVFVQGFVVPAGNGGRILRALRVYLSPP
jgi:hypothetical protein